MCPLNMLFPKVDGTSEQPIHYNTGSFNENLNALLNNVIQVDASMFYISLKSCSIDSQSALSIANLLYQ